MQKSKQNTQNGNSIAFFSDLGGNPDIYVMSSDSSHVEQLTRDAFASLYFTKSPDDRNPSWSPDGSQIAFESGRDNQKMTYVDHDIYVMSASGSTVKRPSQTMARMREDRAGLPMVIRSLMQKRITFQLKVSLRIQRGIFM